jgi:membrane associated rhomboid family serine protease
MTKWVSTIIAANIAVFALQYLVPGTTQALALIPAQVAAHPWTPITYMFVHGGFWHIFVNMLVLYFFGPRVETLLGGRRFLVLYFLSGLGGAFLSFLPMYYYAEIIGASGAIFGVVTAYARVWPRDRIYIYGILPIQAWWFVVLYAAYSVIGGMGLAGAGTAHFGHLGGIIVGYFYMTWLARHSAARRFQREASTVTPATSDTDALRRWNAIPVAQLHELNRGEVLRLLEKVRTQGPRSLTMEERATLDRFSVS